jgi:hypothetical protein
MAKRKTNKTRAALFGLQNVGQFASDDDVLFREGTSEIISHQ